MNEKEQYDLQLKALKSLIFVEHIEQHLKDMYGSFDPRVICKICGKTIDEIVKEFFDK